MLITRETSAQLQSTTDVLGAHTPHVYDFPNVTLLSELQGPQLSGFGGEIFMVLCLAFK